jgi:hypothetical protein
VDTDSYEETEQLSPREKYPPGWSEGDIERLVGKISQRVIDNFYQEVGKNVIKRILQAVGWAVVAGLTFFGLSKVKQWLP